MKLDTFIATLLISATLSAAALAQKGPITAADQLPRRTDHLKRTVLELLADKPQLDRPGRTLQESKFHASMFRDAVDYIKKQAVRIVNVIWRYTVVTPSSRRYGGSVARRIATRRRWRGARSRLAAPARCGGDRVRR